MERLFSQTQSYEEKITRTLMTLKEFLATVPEDLDDDAIDQLKNNPLVRETFDALMSAMRDCVTSIELGKDIRNLGEP
jgi:hypothetical protein